MGSLDNRVLAYDILMFLSILLLVLALVPPLFSRHVVRGKTWYSLMLSLLVFSIGDVLLVGHQDGSKVDETLCLIQVAIINSTPPLITAATASYSSDIYVSIRRMFESDDFEGGPEPHSEIVMVLVPWIVFFLVFLESILVVGLGDQGAVRPADPAFYCRTTSTPAVAVTAAVIIVSVLSAIALQAATGWILYKNWIKVQNISITATARKYFHAFVRTIAFTTAAVIGLSLGIVTTTTIHTTLPGFSLTLPLFPIFAALIFGTYKDIMSFYIFWR